MSDVESRPLSLFQELKRRKVFRVGAAYAASAFVALQAADLLASGLALPHWVFASLTVLAIVGVPVALVLAWVYELTPDGVRVTDDKALPGSVPYARTVRGFAGGAVLASALGFGGWWMWRALPAADDALRVVAVLPFENITADGAEAHFAAGMRAEIMSHLSRVSDLRLLSTASIAAIEDAPNRLGRLTDELGVGSALEGRVRIVGGGARLDVQLTDARNGRTLWSEQYDRDVTDVLAVQTDVALRVVRALHARLSPQERARVQASPTRDPAADDLFLRGREAMGASRDQLIAAAELFRQAVRLDRDFALAESHLARAYMFLAYQGDLAALDSAMVISRRALATDSTLPHAWFTLGGALGYAGRTAESIRALERALAVDPNYAGAMNDLAVTLAQTGRWDEALHWAEQALARAPNLANNYYHTGLPLALLGDDSASERFLLEGLAKRSEGFHRVHLLLAYVELHTGRPEQGLTRMAELAVARPTSYEVRLLYTDLAELTRAAVADSLIEALFHNHAEAWSFYLPQTTRSRFARVLLERGDSARAHRLLDYALTEARRRLDEGRDAPEIRMELAAIHALRGEREAALRWAQRAYEAGYRWHRMLAAAPSLDSIRDAPEFQAIMARTEADVAAMRGRAAERSPLL